VNRLKNINLALLNYHSGNGSFPPPFVADERGTPLSSWRVLLLPFLNAQDVYRQYRLDEPWNSEHNRSLLRRHPELDELFACPYREDDERQHGTTNYVAVLGPKTAWQPGRTVSLQDISGDGSETILVGEIADSGIHWAEPRDLHVLQMAPTINPKEGQGISSHHQDGAPAGFADGHIRFLFNDTGAGELRRLLTIRGAKPEKPVDD
jgi:prepilin-type processing-associated H-X9-DG protein